MYQTAIAPKAVAYLRVSSKGQIDGDGFPRQMESCERFAATRGYDLVAAYIEMGVSGTKELVDRIALTDLLDQAEENGITIILVERTDRLARRALAAEILLADIQKHGLSVFVSESGMEMTSDEDDFEAKLLRQFMCAIDEYEKNKIVSRLRKARNRKKAATNGREGKEGNKSFGSDARESAILDTIRDLRSASPTLTSRQLTQRLNECGYRSRLGGPMTPGAVHSLVRRYCSA